MTTMQATLWILGVLVGLLGIGGLCLWFDKHYSWGNYDERQITERAKAYRFAQWVGFVYFLIVAMILISQVEGEKTIEPYLLVFWGVMLQLFAANTYCVLTHAALPFTKKQSRAVFGYPVLALTYLAQIPFSENPRLELVGTQTQGWIMLTTGMAFLYLSILHMIQYLRDRKEG